MKIDFLTFEQCGKVAEIERKSFSTPWSKQSFENEFKYDFAKIMCLSEDDEIIGYIGFHNICFEMEITTFAVDERFRGMGFGEKLFLSLIEYAKKEKVKLINLEVREHNIPAVSLYKKLGFIINGRRKNYYSQPCDDALLMTLTL